jgi:hypothetical protein
MWSALSSCGEAHFCVSAFDKTLLKFKQTISFNAPFNRSKIRK